MEIDGVFSGGGMKAIAFVGALEVMEQKGFTFKRVAGTSAGAIISSLIIAGYEAKEIKDILFKVDFKMFMDNSKAKIVFPLFKWMSLYWRMGMYKGNTLEKWMENLLRKKGIETFADIEPNSLKIIASDLTKGKIVVLPDDLKYYGLNEQAFSIAKAVRMSASIPYFFEPIKIYDRLGIRSIIVDGAVLSNFPIWLFEKEKQERPVIGFRLSPKMEEIPPNTINNAVEMLPALVETMLQAHDARYISKSVAKDIIFIPIESIKATEFNLSAKDKKQLIAMGKEQAEDFFKKWKP